MDFSGKKIAVFGMGKSGISALKLLVKLGADPIAVSNGEVEKWRDLDTVVSIISKEKCFPQSESTELFGSCDLVILSPGIPREHEVLALAVKNGTSLWSEIELAYSQLQNKVPLVAVTGTNGKTTTVSMIGEVFKAAGISAFIGGNIGIPFCDYILQGEGAKYIVLELSSFQLESIEQFRPDIAMVLNIFPNHGERYNGVVDYAEAKFNISKNMTDSDSVILAGNDEHLMEWGRKLITKVVKINTLSPLNAKSIIEESYCLENFKLQGGHNITNLLFAIKCMAILEIDTAAVQNMINSFGGVEFRVQFVDGPGIFTAFNDAKSTNWDAVKTAVNAIEKEERELHLIIGGQRRGQGDTLIPHLDMLKKADKIMLIGETTDQFSTELEGEIDCAKCFDLQTVLELERKQEFEGILLFSPGLPSYDQYDNYIKRGEHFTELVGKK
ncbi:MAG: UDP-N-acetylmuramoyl-L-alanine--D-glutamate ligase [Bacteriovoracaceae bacterium]|nr:UDP-N-acetylmuramoyl-L-alanine--D-glutamate ligase [Bacteriovoracaceae bacterium]